MAGVKSRQVLRSVLGFLLLAHFEQTTLSGRLFYGARSGIRFSSQQPDTECERVGQFLIDPRMKCSYKVCDYGSGKDQFNNQALISRSMPCAPGTQVPDMEGQQRTYEGTTPCSQKHNRLCPAPGDRSMGYRRGPSPSANPDPINLDDWYRSNLNDSPSRYMQVMQTMWSQVEGQMGQVQRGGRKRRGEAAQKQELANMWLEMNRKLREIMLAPPAGYGQPSQNAYEEEMQAMQTLWLEMWGKMCQMQKKKNRGTSMPMVSAYGMRMRKMPWNNGGSFSASSKHGRSNMNGYSQKMTKMMTMSKIEAMWLQMWMIMEQIMKKKRREANVGAANSYDVPSSDSEMTGYGVGWHKQRKQQQDSAPEEMSSMWMEMWKKMQRMKQLVDTQKGYGQTMQQETGGYGQTMQQETGGYGQTMQQETGGYGQNMQQGTGGYGQAMQQETGGYGQNMQQGTGGYGQNMQQGTGGYGQAMQQGTGGYGQAMQQETGGYGQNMQQGTGGYGQTMQQETGGYGQSRQHGSMGYGQAMQRGSTGYGQAMKQESGDGYGQESRGSGTGYSKAMIQGSSQRNRRNKYSYRHSMSGGSDHYGQSMNKGGQPMSQGHGQTMQQGTRDYGPTMQHGQSSYEQPMHQRSRSKYGQTMDRSSMSRYETPMNLRSSSSYGRPTNQGSGSSSGHSMLSTKTKYGNSMTNKMDRVHEGYMDAVKEWKRAVGRTMY